MKTATSLLAAAAAALALPAAAFAQAGAPAPAPAAKGALPTTAATANVSASITSGATVYDTAGGVVGTVDSVDAGFAVVSTTKSKVRLPVSSFGKGDKGPLLAMTAAQLDAAAAAAAPPATTPAGPPKLAVGTVVNDQGGEKVGTIESVDAGFAVLATANSKVRLPLSSFAMGTNGPIIGMTAAQLDQAAAAAKPNGG